MAARDSQHESPLIRGLAIRTMSAVNVEKMADYLADPLKRALRDSGHGSGLFSHVLFGVGYPSFPIGSSQTVNGKPDILAPVQTLFKRSNVGPLG